MSADIIDITTRIRKRIELETQLDVRDNALLCAASLRAISAWYASPDFPANPPPDVAAQIERMDALSRAKALCNAAGALIPERHRIAPLGQRDLELQGCLRRLWPDKFKDDESSVVEMPLDPQARDDGRRK